MHSPLLGASSSRVDTLPVWVAPVSGLLGAIIGGACSLVGTWVSQHYQAKREEKRLAAEEERRRLRELKDAYAEWFGSVQQLVMGMTTNMALNHTDPAAAVSGLLGTVPETTATGYRVRLLESDPEARKRTVEIVNAVSILAAKLVGADSGNPLEVGALAAEVMSQLAEVELWLVNVRFAPTERLAPKN